MGLMCLGSECGCGGGGRGDTVILSLLYKGKYHTVRNKCFSVLKCVFYKILKTNGEVQYQPVEDDLILL